MMSGEAGQDNNAVPPSVVVKAVVYNRDGYLLLQHRDNIENIIEPDCWSLFGGGVEEGEMLTEALERELLEELSCKVGEIEEELFRWDRSPENSLHVCYSVRFTASNEEMVLTEGQGFAWFPPAELVKLPLGMLVRDNLSRILEFAERMAAE